MRQEPRRDGRSIEALRPAAGAEVRPAFERQRFGYRRRQTGFPVVNVSNRSDVDVRFVPYKFFFRHWGKFLRNLAVRGTPSKVVFCLPCKTGKPNLDTFCALLPNNKKRHPAGL